MEGLFHEKRVSMSAGEAGVGCIGALSAGVDSSAGAGSSLDPQRYAPCPAGSSSTDRSLETEAGMAKTGSEVRVGMLGSALGCP